MKKLIKRCLKAFSKEARENRIYEDVINRSCRTFMYWMEWVEKAKTYEVVYYVNWKKVWTQYKK